MIKELHAGDTQISASGWNEMRAAVQGITAPQQQYQSGRLNPVYVTIHNHTGYALPAFSVVKINGAEYSRTGSTFVDLTTQGGVELSGYAPTAANDTIAITQEACPAGGIVKALMSGATACKIYKTSSSTPAYAMPTNSYEHLSGSEAVTGIKVLWSASGTGAKDAIVRLGTYNPQTILNVTVDDTTTGGGGPVYTTIDGVQWEVIFPNAAAGLSATNYPDIYAYDQILVLLDLNANLCYALDYPTDYEAGSIQAFYQQPGRGWDNSAVTTPQAMTDVGLTLYQKVKTNAIL